MLRYGDEIWTELIFAGFNAQFERRDGQWIDVTLTVELDERTPLPGDVQDFAIVAICTHKGDPIELAVTEQGCDSEYQLTAFEKEQLFVYLRTDHMRKAIQAAAQTVSD